MTEHSPVTPTGRPTAGPPDGPPATAGRRGAIPHATRTIAEYTFFATIYWLGWAWAASVVVWAVIVFFIERAGNLERSIWDFAGLGWSRWAVFAAGAIAATQLLPVLITHGQTRRAAARGGLIGLGAIAVLGTIVVTAIHGVEQLVFSWADVTRTFEDVHLWGDDPNLGLIALDALLVFGAYGVSGLIVGIFYYRTNGWVGTLLLPLGLLPLVVVEVLVSSTVIPDGFELWSTSFPVAIDVVAGLAVIAAGAVATQRLMRDVTLRPRPR